MLAPDTAAGYGSERECPVGTLTGLLVAEAVLLVTPGRYFQTVRQDAARLVDFAPAALQPFSPVPIFGFGLGFGLGLGFNHHGRFRRFRDRLCSGSGSTTGLVQWLNRPGGSVSAGETIVTVIGQLAQAIQ